jgi:hypothetical protein
MTDEEYNEKNVLYEAGKFCLIDKRKFFMISSISIYPFKPKNLFHI